MHFVGWLGALVNGQAAILIVSDAACVSAANLGGIGEGLQELLQNPCGYLVLIVEKSE